MVLRTLLPDGRSFPIQEDGTYDISIQESPGRRGDDRSQHIAVGGRLLHNAGLLQHVLWAMQHLPVRL
jgi:hypothetical protein